MFYSRQAIEMALQIILIVWKEEKKLQKTKRERQATTVSVFGEPVKWKKQKYKNRNDWTFGMRKRR